MNTNFNDVILMYDVIFAKITSFILAILEKNRKNDVINQNDVLKHEIYCNRLDIEYA